MMNRLPIVLPDTLGRLEDLDLSLVSLVLLKYFGQKFIDRFELVSQVF